MKRILAAVLVLVAMSGKGADKMKPKEECQMILDATLPIVETLLEKNGEFFPTGAYMSSTGTISHLSFYDGREQPPSVDVMDGMKSALRALATKAEIKAYAMLYDVRVVPPGKTVKQDAIAIDLEHRDDYQVTVIFPYTLEKGHKPILDAPFATAKKREIFVQSPNNRPEVIRPKTGDKPQP
jgi:hypothetical protein